MMIPFRRFGTMIDCSRNAVMNVPTMKKWMDISASLGYSAVFIYIEDTYEIPEEPFFGYCRGRYTQAELRELDAYAKSKGLELIPCMQTLAHVNAITRWPTYWPIIDTGDILLAGEERTYELVDRMFASLASCLSTKVINVGMDEAEMIGRGKYYNKHGDRNKSQILIEHVQKICEIAKKYGFTLCMWSDMFFKLVVGEYYKATEINEEVRAQIPDNMQLCYWDYYSRDKKRYDGMMKAHAKIKDNTWFAGGLWSWIGFAPDNEFSMKATNASLSMCRKNNIQDVFLTMWGDNGGECSKFSLLPALFYASEIAKGNNKKSDIKKKFQETFGISFDTFMNMDMKKGMRPGEDPVNPDKYLFYNDPFTGIHDTTLVGNEGEIFKSFAKKLGKGKKHPEWGYLFTSMQALADFLSVKADLGVRTRKAYASKDAGELADVIARYKLASKKLKAYHKAYKVQWFKENKPHGFDIQDMRMGGLMQRLESCRERLEAYAAGAVDCIPELEEKQLPFTVDGSEFKPQATLYNTYGGSSSANVL